MSKAKPFIARSAEEGQYHFTGRDFARSSGVSAGAAKLALYRQGKQGEIASPARGFYVIVPPEYRRLGCLPADQFIPSLMEHRGLSYYACLLSAAEYYGAAHHRPQVFQVAVAKTRRPIVCGAVRVQFVARKRIDDIPVQSFNTPRGTIRVSTAEATAVDLVGYQQHAGGLSSVATVLAELAESIDPQRLAKAAETAPMPWAQRLGYLLELVGASKKTKPLSDYVRRHATEAVPLLPSKSHARSKSAATWKLRINAIVEWDE